MATRESADGQVQLPHMGGLNERPAPNALESPSFDICQGLYPARDGLLQRMEGKQLLAQQQYGIRNLAQLDDGTGQVIVQDTAGNETLYSLDELFGRPDPEVDLEYEPIVEEDSMSMALIVHQENQGTNGGSLDAGAGSEVLNTYYRQKLTNLTLNEDAIVSSFVADGGGADENTFQLATGDYRVEGTMTFNCVHRNLNEVLGTVSITIASPAVISLTNSFVAGDAVKFSTTGALPTGLTVGTQYYVLAAGLSGSSFRVSTTPGGAAVNTSGIQSGTHTANWVFVTPTAVAVLHDETNDVVLSTSTPVFQNQYPGTTDAATLTMSIQMVLGFQGSFSLSGTAKISIKAAVNSLSLLNWADDTTCRGVSHSVTSLVGGVVPKNIYTSLKILKEVP